MHAALGFHFVDVVVLVGELGEEVGLEGLLGGEELSKQEELVLSFNQFLVQVMFFVD